MAYMNQEKKSQIAAALKKVVPAGWKYTLAVRNHSTIVLTITEAPVDIIRAMQGSDWFKPETVTEAKLNHHHIRENFTDECVADVFEKIAAALNIDNHDNSDISTDYFDVGHYVDIRIGKWDKPFCYVPQAVKAAA